MAGTRLGRRPVVPPNGTESATRVADILLLFAGEAGSLGVTEVGRRLGLSKAVVHRILCSLESRDLLRFDDDSRAYHLGPAAVALGARALHQQDLRSAALPVLRRLQELTGETATVSALVGTARIYLDQVPSHRELKMMVETGRAFPLHAGSSSKVILAVAPSELREQIVGSELARLTDRTISEREELEKELARIRRLGYAVSRGERQHGAASVAAAVFGPDGNVVGSVSVCGPVSRFEPKTMRQVAPLVQRAAEEVSRRLHEVPAHLATTGANGG